ncbi:testis-expressed basic protein 1 [Myotis myotis]|uniref:testis-expressed basic protein 1 n=1 Tax=Myotis myotis TaxID=51298 RepID=UPI00174E76A9|nr:testis-expressed basic protein 1 [Myotis myotis]
MESSLLYLKSCDFFVSEITLAVILTLLGLAILAILLTRWTRRKQNEMDVSRYNSEQSASLLDYEHGRDFSSQRSEGGRGLRHSYSTESVDDSGKITLSPMVIFPGYMDGELAKKSDPRVSILKTGGTAKSKRSEDKNKEALKKEISFTGSEESLVHKTKSERKAKDTDLDTGKIDMEAKVKGSDMGMPRREEAQVKASEAGIPQGQASQEKENEVEIPQGQATQEKENEVEIPQGQATQEKENEVEIPQGQAASQEKEGEVEIPQGPESQVKKSEAKTPKGPKAKVKKSEAGTPQGQKPQENTESSEAKGNQVKEKEDAGKTEDTKETDAKDKKSGEGKDQVKGKKEPQVKRKKAEAKKETGN